MSELLTLPQFAAWTGWHPQDITDHVHAVELYAHGKIIDRGEVAFVPSAFMAFNPDTSTSTHGFKKGEALPNLRGHFERLCADNFHTDDCEVSKHRLVKAMTMYHRALEDDPLDSDARARLETLEVVAPMIFADVDAKRREVKIVRMFTGTFEVE